LHCPSKVLVTCELSLQWQPCVLVSTAAGEKLPVNMQVSMLKGSQLGFLCMNFAIFSCLAVLLRIMFLRQALQQQLCISHIPMPTCVAELCDTLLC